MRDWNRRALSLIAVIALVVAAYAPLARAGFVGADLAVLADASAAAWPADALPLRSVWSRFVAGDTPPLAAASLALSSRVWSDVGRFAPSDALALRIENLVLLLVAGWAVGKTVRRALVPWWGTEVARSAAWASVTILAAHPLCVAAVASPASRGDLLALALCAVAGIVFLRARQEQRPAGVFVAALLALLGALASEFALFLPFVLAILEYASARRLRAPSARLRTSATTLLVFLALASMPAWLALLAGAPVKTPTFFASAANAFDPESAAEFARDAVRKLSVLIFPVPQEIEQRVGYAIAGLAVLVALQPAFAAARSAPRLWGWILVAWCTSVSLGLLFAADAVVTPGNLTNSAVLLPTTFAMAAGFAVTSTALSGVRRTVLPLAIAAGYAVLAHAAATAWPRASAALAALEHDLAQAQLLDGGAVQILVLDPPQRVAGLEVVGDSLALLAEAPFEPRADAGEGARSVRTLTGDALFAFAREPEFEELRAAGLVLVRPQDESARSAGLTSIALTAPVVSEVSAGPLVWRGENQSPQLKLDPRRHRAVRVTVLPSASTSAAPRMLWRSRAEAFKNDAVEGAWIEGSDGPVALFDLNRSMAWLAGEEIRRIWFEGGLSDIASAEILPDVPAFAHEIAPRVDGTSFVFTPPREVPRALHGDARWIVGVLDLASYRYREFGAEASTAELSFPGAAAFESELLAAGGGPIAWSLELRVGETALSRAAGRRPAR